MAFLEICLVVLLVSGFTSLAVLGIFNLFLDYFAYQYKIKSDTNLKKEENEQQ